jgi:hypothetical protein
MAHEVMIKPTLDPKQTEASRVSEELERKKYFDQVVNGNKLESKSAEHPEALLVTLRACGQFGQPVPVWARNQLALAAASYLSAQVKTLDEALGLARPSRWELSEASFDALHGLNCFIQVNKLVAEINPTTGKNYSKTYAYDAAAEYLKGIGATRRKVARNFNYWNNYLKKST